LSYVKRRYISIIDVSTVTVKINHLMKVLIKKRREEKNEKEKNLEK
jgi:hypothetical protein